MFVFYYLYCFKRSTIQDQKAMIKKPFMNIKMRKINSLNYIVFSIPRHFPELTTRDLVAKFIPDVPEIPLCPCSLYMQNDNLSNTPAPGTVLIVKFPTHGIYFLIKSRPLAPPPPPRRPNIDRCIIALEATM